MTSNPLDVENYRNRYFGRRSFLDDIHTDIQSLIGEIERLGNKVAELQRERDRLKWERDCLAQSIEAAGNRIEQLENESRGADEIPASTNSVESAGNDTRQCRANELSLTAAKEQSTEEASVQPDQYAAHSPECFLRKYREGFCDCDVDPSDNVPELL